MSPPKLTLSEEFAKLLYDSLIPEELKKEILESLKIMNQEQIQALYKVLAKEKTNVQLLKKQFEMQIHQLRQNS